LVVGGGGTRKGAGLGGAALLFGLFRPPVPPTVEEVGMENGWQNRLL